MPQFILNGKHESLAKESPFVAGFIEALFFTESATTPESEWDATPEEERTQDGNLPSDCGYFELDDSSLEAIRADCATWQEANAELLQAAYSYHWQKAAMREGWTRVPHSGLFNGPLDSETRLADYESWEELCECEGIDAGEEYDAEQAGRDYWFTRNGHGVGFWDRGLGDVGKALTSACEYREVWTHYDAGRVYAEGLSK